MPGEGAPPVMPESGAGEKQIELAKPSFGKQMAQLVVIPAVITLAAVGIVVLFAQLGGQQDNIEDQLNRLRQSGGAGRMAYGLQDPRYKDRSFAAASLAEHIREVKDPAERQRISKELIDILDHNVAPEEEMMQIYLLIALGRLGQDDGLEAIIQRFNARESKTREGAIYGVAAWADDQSRLEQARRAVPGLTKLLADEVAVVRMQAAATLGTIAQPGDEAVTDALWEAAAGATGEDREVYWNAAVALARLGDPRGSQIVATLLLDRQALSQLTDTEQRGGRTGAMLSGRSQDQIILNTLKAAVTMTDPIVWDKIKALAEDDPSPAIRNAAKKLVLQRNKDQSTQGSTTNDATR